MEDLERARSAVTSQAVVVNGLVYGADAAVSRWMAKRMNVDTFDPSQRAIGVLSKDRSRLIAGVSYHGYSGANIMQSVAADDPSWCRPSVVRAMFFYPFVTLKCQRITSIIAVSNERSIRLCEGLGFTREGTMRRMMPGNEDAFVYGLLADECRYLRRDDGQRRAGTRST